MNITFPGGTETATGSRLKPARHVYWSIAVWKQGLGFG